MSCHNILVFLGSTDKRILAPVKKKMFIYKTYREFIIETRKIMIHRMQVSTRLLNAT